MKKLLVITLCLLAIGGTYGIAKDSETPFVKASSTVSKEVSPNFVEINISVETKDKTAEETAKLNAETSTKVVTTLKELLDPKKGDFIETTNYNLSPQYTYKDGKNILTGYLVTNTVKVKTRDIKSVSALIDEALKAGATNISGLNFGLDNEAATCNELYATATKNAYSQAQSVAKALGSVVTGAKSINTSCSIEGTNARYSRALMLDSSNAAGHVSTPVESANIKIHATIQGTFNIK